MIPPPVDHMKSSEPANNEAASLAGSVFSRFPSSGPMIAWLIAITAVKAALAARWGFTMDIPQTFAQGNAFLHHADWLDPAATGGNPSFFPVGDYLIAAACVRMSQWTGLPFAWLVKLPAILADLAVALQLRALPRAGPVASRYSEWAGNRAALLYMLNPVTFVLSVYHGQLHTVAMAGAVVALAIAADHAIFAGVILGLSASIRQHFGVLLWPLALTTRRRGPMIAAFTLTALLVNWPLILSARPARLLAPTWTYGSWGYTMILLQGPRVLSLLGWPYSATLARGINHLLASWGSSIYWIWAATFAWWTWRRRAAHDVWYLALTFLLGLYALSPGFGVQWLVWVVPFWIIVSPSSAMRYSVLAGAFLLGSYWQWSLNERLGVRSLTENLSVLPPPILAGVLLVGALGFATWLYVTRATWRLMRA